MTDYEPRRGDICTIGGASMRWMVQHVGRYHGGQRMVSLARVEAPPGARMTNTTVDVRRLRLVELAPEEPAAPFLSSGALRIVDERHRAARAHGFTPEHDVKTHSFENGLSNLTIAALCCLTAAMQRAGEFEVDVPAWPADWTPFESKSIDDDLVRAGAFIAAELDRRHLAEQVGE